MKDYGFSIRERSAPGLGDDVRRDLIRAIVDAPTEPDASTTHVQAARQAFLDIERGLDGWFTDRTDLSEEQKNDLKALVRSTKVSRAAVMTSPVFDAPGLVRACVIDNVECWFIMGDWRDRDLSAAEVIVRLQEEGANFDPEANYADRALLEKARKEQGISPD